LWLSLPANFNITATNVNICRM